MARYVSMRRYMFAPPLGLTEASSITILFVALVSLGSAFSCASGRADGDRDGSVTRSQKLQNQVDAGMPSRAGNVAPNANAVGTSPPDAHARSATALMVGWQDSPEASPRPLQQLKALVLNTTDVPIDADVSALMLAQNAAERTNMLLGHYSIPSQGRVELKIDVSNLPVQSSGIATPLQLVAQYQSADSIIPPGASSAPIAPWSVSSYSPPLYLTHEADFRSATIRSEQAEAQFNGKQLQAGQRPMLTGLRVNGLDATANAPETVSTQIIVSAPAGAPAPAPLPERIAP